MVVLVNLGQIAPATQQIFNPQCHPHVALIQGGSASLYSWNFTPLVRPLLWIKYSDELQGWGIPSTFIFHSTQLPAIYGVNPNINQLYYRWPRRPPKQNVDSRHLWITWFDYSTKKRQGHGRGHSNIIYMKQVKMRSVGTSSRVIYDSKYFLHGYFPKEKTTNSLLPHDSSLVGAERVVNHTQYRTVN